MKNQTKQIKSKYPIIFVVYRDIVLWDGQVKKDSGFPVHIFQVAGFLIEDNKDDIVISREVVTNQNDDLRGAMTIPKETIIYREILNVKRKTN